MYPSNPDELESPHGPAIFHCGTATQTRPRPAWAIALVIGCLLSAAAVPAAADPDCNQNGVDDGQDLLSSDFGDCNNNGVLDVCDVAPADPDGNGLVSVDLNHNRRPDECDLGGRLVGLGGHLFDINMATGHATRFIEPAGMRSDELPSWIFFAPDGTMFGLSGRTLRTISRTDWTTSFVVELDQDVISPTFSPAGLLYAMSNDGLYLDSVDIDTGMVTNIGPFGFPKVAGVAFAPNGHLYGVSATGNYSPNPFPFLEVDLQTGAATQVGLIPRLENGGQVDALAFAPDGASYVSFTKEGTQLGQTYAGALVRSTTNGGQTGGTWLPFSSGPTSIAFTPDGVLYGLIGQGQPMTIDVNTGYCRPATGVFATHIAASPDGRLVGVSDAWSTINLDTGGFTMLSIISFGYTPEYVYSFTICPNGSYHRIGLVDGFCSLDCAGCGWELSCSLDLACAPDGTLMALQGNQIVRFDEFRDLLIPVATLDAPLNDIAFASQGIAYGFDASQLATVDVETGYVVPIGPLGTSIHDITYIPAKIDLQKLHGTGACVAGPDAPLANGCEVYDFDGDGAVDLRDISGLWLVIPGSAVCTDISCGCIPNCAGRECGNDGCGGSCGTCDDGNPCNGVETCGPNRTCIAGTPLNCNDGNACNGVETCDPASGCHPGAPLNCNDGNFCNGIESCNPQSGCRPGTPLNCNDGNFCNGIESCNPQLGCRPGTPLHCNDGNECNGVETCVPASGCVPGTLDELTLDIGPGDCPNVLNIDGRYSVQVAIVATPRVAVSDIDIDSLTLLRADGLGEPIQPYLGFRHNNVEILDVATPTDGSDCACNPCGPDGLDDLIIEFPSGQLMRKLDLDGLPSGTSVELLLNGSLLDGTPVELSDCVQTAGGADSRHKEK